MRLGRLGFRSILRSGRGTGGSGGSTTPAPTLTATPQSGPWRATSITFAGTNLTGCTGVTINGVACTGVSSTSTSVTVTTPAFSANGGPYNVVATTPSGNSGTTGNGIYTVAADSTDFAITSISKSVVDASGGSSIVLTGHGFSIPLSPAVTFGGTSAASFVVSSDTQITAFTPAKTASATAVDVVVSGGGASSTLAASVEFFWPTNISGLTQWLRGDIGVTVVAGKSTAWADQSGNGLDFVDWASNAPLAPVAGINGKLAVPFDASRYSASGDSLGFSSSTPSLITSMTAAEAFVVAQEIGGTANQSFWFYGQGTGGFYPFSGVVYENFGISSRPDSSSNPGGGSLPAATSPWLYNPRVAATTFDLYINGQHMIAATDTTVAWPTVSVQVGRNGVGLPMTGIINELAIYDKVLSSGERARFTAYKADRYAF